MAGDPAVKQVANLLKEATFFARPKADAIYELSDFPTHMEANPGLLQADNLWALGKAQKIQLLYTLIIGMDVKQVTSIVPCSCRAQDRCL